MQQDKALLVSMALEVPTAVLMGAALGVRRRDLALRLALTAIAATAASHPLAWWLNQQIPLPFAERATIVELAVTLVEALLYAWLVPLTRLHAAIVSAAANAASFGLGLWIYAYWPQLLR